MVNLDATSTNTGSGSFTHPGGTPTAVVVFVGWNTLFGTVTACTYGGVSMTNSLSGGVGDGQSSMLMFTLASPPPGSQTVAITSTAGGAPLVTCVSVTGSDPATVYSDAQSLPSGWTGVATTSITLAAHNGDLCVDCIMEVGDSVHPPQTMTPGPPNSTIYGPFTNNAVGGPPTMQGSDASATGTTTMTWAVNQFQTAGGGLMGLAFKNAPAGGQQPTWAEVVLGG